MSIDMALPLNPKPRRGGMFLCSEDAAPPTELGCAAIFVDMIVKTW